MSTTDHKKDVIDPQLEEARKSMGNRVDQGGEAPKVQGMEEDTPVAPVEEKKVDEKKPEDKPVVQEEEKKPAEDEKKPDQDDLKVPNNDDKQPVNRREAFIPMPKYLDEKKVWQEDKAERQRLEARVKELEAIGTADTTAKGHEELVKTFAEKHDMDPDLVKDLLETVSTTLLPKDKLAKLDEALKVVDTQKHEEQVKASQVAFKGEFDAVALPDLQKRFPNATAEQLEAARIFLDGAAHTEQFHKSELGYVIYKLEGELSKIFTATDDAKVDETDEKPASNKTMEHSRSGHGKSFTLSAADFKGKKDFSELLTLDPSVQERVRKEFDADTYQSYQRYMIEQEKAGGIEVTRDGRKVKLK